MFVNSSLGEIRGMVYSRGISADSSDGATGQYYVSMQEDGLPITNIAFGNYNASYFNRPDATLQRVEAVRGGSASITSSNSPGGAFNYISRTGSARAGGEIRTRFGLEGRGEPHYRADLVYGGPLGRTGWVYSIGGFYRHAVGHRPADGYPMNNGFVTRGNLFKDYGRGSVKIYGKYMDDRNHWYEYLLARDPQNPKQFPGLSRYSTNLLPKSSHQYPRESDTTFGTFDTADAVRSRQRYVGIDWKHEFGDGWSLSHNVKFSRSWADWNSSAGVTPRSLEWPNFSPRWPSSSAAAAPRSTAGCRPGFTASPTDEPAMSSPRSLPTATTRSTPTPSSTPARSSALPISPTRRSSPARSG